LIKALSEPPSEKGRGGGSSSSDRDDSVASLPLLLLVEDEPLIALSTQYTLEDGGFAVLVAADGVEAVGLLECEIGRISALVTDIRLGGVPDGWDLARHARAVNPALPVIYTTGDSAHQWPIKGVTGSLLVQKPYPAARLVAAVSALLASDAPAGQAAIAASPAAIRPIVT
jgi:DNA-binding response OmpR family regulator